MRNLKKNLERDSQAPLNVSPPYNWLLGVNVTARLLFRKKKWQKQFNSDVRKLGAITPMHGHEQLQVTLCVNTCN